MFQANSERVLFALFLAGTPLSRLSQIPTTPPSPETIDTGIAQKWHHMVFLASKNSSDLVQNQQRHLPALPTIHRSHHSSHEKLLVS